MKLTIQKFSEDMLKKYPHLADDPAYKAFHEVSKTRAVGSMQFEVQLLTKDYEQHVLDTAGKLKKVATVVPKETAAAIVAKRAEIDAKSSAPVAGAPSPNKPQTPAPPAAVQAAEKKLQS